MPKETPPDYWQKEIDKRLAQKGDEDDDKKRIDKENEEIAKFWASPDRLKRLPEEEPENLKSGSPYGFGSDKTQNRRAARTRQKERERRDRDAELHPDEEVLSNITNALMDFFIVPHSQREEFKEKHITRSNGWVVVDAHEYFSFPVSVRVNSAYVLQVSTTDFDQKISFHKPIHGFEIMQKETQARMWEKQSSADTLAEDLDILDLRLRNA